MLQVGIARVALGGAAHRLYWATWRWTGRPEWMADFSLTVTAPAVMLIAGGYILHILVAKGRTRGVMIAIGLALSILYILGQVLSKG